MPDGYYNVFNLTSDCSTTYSITAIKNFVEYRFPNINMIYIFFVFRIISAAFYLGKIYGIKITELIIMKQCNY